MQVEIKFPNMKPFYIEAKNTYLSYCHYFTKEVILGIFRQGKLDYRLHNYMNDLAKPETSNNESILSLYINMSIAVGGHKIFNKDNMACVIQGPGLILFASAPLDPEIKAEEQTNRILHSMIALEWNIWQGANNLSSLGAEDIYVHSFEGMDQRSYQSGEKPGEEKQGGWGSDKLMHSVKNDVIYTMYYIPLFAEGVDDGCCPGCIIA